MKKRNRYKTEEGLRFECVSGCTKCCAIPGFIFVHEKEIPAMADFFGMATDEFMKKYIKKYFGDVHRLNCPDDDPCMFLTEKGCSIYPVRPIQCRSFPFWPENISNVDNWENLKKMCPGIGRGRLFTVDEITDIAAEVSFGPFLC